MKQKWSETQVIGKRLIKKKSNAFEGMTFAAANTAEAYSITDRIREQYTVIRSDVGTPHFFRVLSA